MNENEEKIENVYTTQDPAFEAKFKTAIITASDDLLQRIIKDRRTRERFAKLYPYIEQLGDFTGADLRKILPPSIEYSRRSLYGLLKSLTGSGILRKERESATYHININNSELLGTLLTDQVIRGQFELYYSKIRALVHETLQALQRDWDDRPVNEILPIIGIINNATAQLAIAELSNETPPPNNLSPLKGSTELDGLLLEFIDKINPPEGEILFYFQSKGYSQEALLESLARLRREGRIFHPIPNGNDIKGEELLDTSEPASLEELAPTDTPEITAQTVQVSTPPDSVEDKMLDLKKEVAEFAQQFEAPEEEVHDYFRMKEVDSDALSAVIQILKGEGYFQQPSPPLAGENPQATPSSDPLDITKPPSPPPVQGYPDPFEPVTPMRAPQTEVRPSKPHKSLTALLIEFVNAHEPTEDEVMTHFEPKGYKAEDVRDLLLKLIVKGTFYQLQHGRYKILDLNLNH